MDAILSRLPPLARSYAERALGSAAPAVRVRVAQQGEMWLKPGARALPFVATETFAVERVAFSWRARFPLLGPLALTVVDRFAEGEGELAVRVLGLRVQRQRGPETTAGEALRYLAELPWVPHAIVRNPGLEWRELDGRRLEVAANVGGERLPVELAFDAGGDVVSVSSQARRRKVGRAWAATPWSGRFDDYASVGGVRVPTTGEVAWELPEGRYVYWRGRVTAVEPESR